MKRTMMLGAMFFICVSFAQVTNDIVTKVPIPETKFNPMTLEGSSRVSVEAESNVYSRLAAQYKCDVVVYREGTIVNAVSIDKWNAGGERGYIEIVYCWPSATQRCATLVRRHSPDGRLVSVEITEKLVSQVDAERKLLRAKYLKELGMTEEEAMKKAREEAMEKAREGGLASLRLARMKMDQEERAREKAGKRAEAERKKFFPPLMPFADAVKKAKGGDGAALYSLALHYAKGEDITKDEEKARLYLGKASDANYPAAVLFDAISKEDEIKGCGSRLNPETGLPHGRIVSFTEWRLRKEKDPIKDTNAVEAVRIGYKKAASLGLTIATNELARFEKRIEEIREAMDIKEKNAVLAKALMTEYEKERAQKEAAAEKLPEERAKQRERLLQIQEQLKKER